MFLNKILISTFIILAVPFSTLYGGIADHTGDIASEARNNIQEVLTGYEGAFNAGDFPAGVIPYFAADVTAVTGSAPAFTGESWEGMINSFNYVGNNATAAGFSPVNIVHEIITYGRSGDKLMARLILTVHEPGNPSNIYDTFNCTFEFTKRTGGTKPSKYVVSYLHFSANDKFSPGMGHKPLP